jgi:eukaryotic-like serine/threonine-protein kinase
MGVSYKAEDTRLHRFRRAQISSRLFGAVARFLLEAHAASALNHPNICTIYDIGEEDGKVFIAMKYLGVALKHLIGGQAMELERLRCLHLKTLSIALC